MVTSTNGGYDLQEKLRNGIKITGQDRYQSTKTPQQEAEALSLFMPNELKGSSVEGIQANADALSRMGSGSLSGGVKKYQKEQYR
ncbi:hypothetical protein EOPP23_16950 [Endozoicomonas sp. OPT23]|uniref:hypothetical protein n=1 Tax=Endozoicomonas sp. OPT23 TaxID=2072845 RepID=UPI00129B25CD|nr:hypothetical protein [Endozoicomonas sp. OPT23]MRI34674.1 hypothetical protein [Endozoicomonas sp. OPT23]